MKHYDLYEPIASGGMGTVHYGRPRSGLGLSRVVAVKRLRGELARDPGCLSMFRDELRLATRVRHPNVVGTLDMVEQEGELLMVMELVQGESLQELIARSASFGQRMPPAIAVSIVCGVLQGLEAAHDATNEAGEPLSIVHRDVSPENILIGRDGIARLLDFGIARGAGRKHVTRIGEIKGKPSYLAPEQILESSEYVDRRADVYGASCVLWEALTGKRLFDGDTPAATLGRVLHDAVPRPSSIVSSLPQGLDEVVMRGLSRDREERFPTALEMARELRRVCGTLLPFEVGEWVVRTASDSLKRQAELVARLEMLPVEPAVVALAEPPARLAPEPSPSLVPDIAPLPEQAPDTTDLGLALSLRPLPMSRAREALGLAGRALGLSAACFVAGLLVVRAATSAAEPGLSAVAVAAAAPATPAAAPEPTPEPVLVPAAPPTPLPSAPVTAKKKKKSHVAPRPVAVSIVSAPKARPPIDDGF